jgi:drug/metabolite transporter (DMT)-like permease
MSVLTKPAGTSAMMRASLWITAGVPTLFVLTWSSGYVVGVVGVEEVGPFTLMFYRFALAAVILAVVAKVTRAPWPTDRRMLGHIVVVGVLIQAIQFTGVYGGIALGVPAGVSALVIGTNPLFTALGSGPLLGERVSSLQWVGAGLGVLGVVFALSDRLDMEGSFTFGVLFTLLGLFGITAGQLYQKKYCAGMDLRTGGAIQLAVAAAVMGGLTAGFEEFSVGLTPTLAWSLLWLALVNSIGATSLLYFMIARGEASRVSSFFYLVPAVTALMAAVTIGQQLSVLAVVGLAVAGIGVFLSTYRRPAGRR